MIKFNKTQFVKNQNAVLKSGAKVADAIQEMVLMGLSYFAEHNDTSILSEVVHTAKGAKSIKANDVKAYIVAHAKVRWDEPKEGQARFKKVGKGDAEVTEPMQTWYEFTKQSAVKPDLSVDSLLASVMKKLNDALEGKGERKVKDGQEKAAELARDHVRDLLAVLNEQGYFPAKAAK